MQAGKTRQPLATRHYAIHINASSWSVRCSCAEFRSLGTAPQQSFRVTFESQDRFFVAFVITDLRRYLSIRNPLTWSEPVVKPLTSGSGANDPKLTTHNELPPSISTATRFNSTRSQSILPTTYLFEHVFWNAHEHQPRRFPNERCKHAHESRQQHGCTHEPSHVDESA